MSPGARFMVDCCASSHVGRVRQGNEDSFFIANLTEGVRRETNGAMRFASGPAGALLAVADGMGGAAAGETASRVGIRTLYAEVQEMIQRRRGDDGDELEEIMSDAVG